MGHFDMPPDPFVSTDITVAVDNVSVRYTAPTTDRSAQDESGPVGRLLNKVLRQQPKVSVRALWGVSFVARRGESIGIVGLNGSGKSTLLRVIAGLERPIRGEVHARSQPVLIGVNAALLPELSGAENVMLGCLAMGLSPEEARAALPGVVELAAIGKAIHLPMKTYSSGMAARLRFAIALATRPDIMLIDEALATGDAAFKDRSKARMDEMRAGAGTVFLVSHAAQTIEEECTRAVWLHRGKLIIEGEAEEVARRYRWFAWNLAKGETDTAKGLLKEAILDGTQSPLAIVAPPARTTPPRHARR